MDQQPKIMGMGDVMKALGVSRQRVVEFVRQGKLHPIRTSAGKIFTESEVMVFKKVREGRAKSNPRMKRGK
jgi:predicted site-specific integrase-resolvase